MLAWKKIQENAKYILAGLLLVTCGPGVIQALFEIGKEVGTAFAFWIG